MGDVLDFPEKVDEELVEVLACAVCNTPDLRASTSGLLFCSECHGMFPFFVLPFPGWVKDGILKLEKDDPN